MGDLLVAEGFFSSRVHEVIVGLERCKSCSNMRRVPVKKTPHSLLQGPHPVVIVFAEVGCLCLVQCKLFLQLLEVRLESGYNLSSLRWPLWGCGCGCVNLHRPHRHQCAEVAVLHPQVFNLVANKSEFLLEGLQGEKNDALNISRFLQLRRLRC